MHRINTRIVISAWLLGIPFSYFTVGFLSNFYPTRYEIIMLTLLIHFSASIIFYHPLKRNKAQSHLRHVDLNITLVLFTVLFIFIVVMFKTAGKFPSLFNPIFYQLEAGQLTSFIVAVTLSLLLSVWVLSFPKSKKFNLSNLFK